MRSDLAAADPYNKLARPPAAIAARGRSDSRRGAGGSRIAGARNRRAGVYPPQPKGIYRFTQQVKFWGEKPRAPTVIAAACTPICGGRARIRFCARSTRPTPWWPARAARARTRRLQALTLANDPAFYEIAQGFASQPAGRAPAADEPARVASAFRRALAREPSAGELARLVDYVADSDRAISRRPAAETPPVAPPRECPPASRRPRRPPTRCWPACC